MVPGGAVVPWASAAVSGAGAGAPESSEQAARVSVRARAVSGARVQVVDTVGLLAIGSAPG